MTYAITPDGRPLVSRMCTCSIHCASSGYHDRACCEVVWCDCWCHEKEYGLRRHGEPPLKPVRDAL